MLFHASFYSSAFSVSFILFNQMIRSLCTEKIGKEARMRIEEGPYFRGLVTIWGLSGQEVRRTAAGDRALTLFPSSFSVCRQGKRTDGCSDLFGRDTDAQQPLTQPLLRCVLLVPPQQHR